MLNKKANIKFEKLDIGDYLIQDTIIERKTFSDFINSMINKRLQEQLINLKKYQRHFLIVEGFDYDYKKYNVHGVQFHTESIKTTIGIKILKNFINYKK